MNHSSIVANKVKVTPYHIKNDLTYLIYNTFGHTTYGHFPHNN